jgi:hypothetical protein
MSLDNQFSENKQPPIDIQSINEQGWKNRAELLRSEYPDFHILMSLAIGLNTERFNEIELINMGRGVLLASDIILKAYPDITNLDIVNTLSDINLVNVGSNFDKYRAELMHKSPKFFQFLQKHTNVYYMNYYGNSFSLRGFTVGLLFSTRILERVIEDKKKNDATQAEETSDEL